MILLSFVLILFFVFISIIQLLDVDEQTRLGNQGSDSIRSHPWFGGIDWKRIEDHSYGVPQEITSRIAQHLETYGNESSVPRPSLSEDLDCTDVPEWLDDW